MDHTPLPSIPTKRRGRPIICYLLRVMKDDSREGNILCDSELAQ
jgi:hypothetical protein